MNSSLRNHELPREMKHHPAHLAEASVFGVHGNEGLRGCEWIDPTLSRFARGGWMTNLPRWPRAQEITKMPDLQFKTGEVLGTPRQVGHLTPRVGSGKMLDWGKIPSGSEMSGLSPQVCCWHLKPLLEVVTLT